MTQRKTLYYDSLTRFLISPRNSGHQVKRYIMIQDEVFYEQTHKKKIYP